MKPMLDPKRDLKGATPETLARATVPPCGAATPAAPQREARCRR